METTAFDRRSTARWDQGKAPRQTARRSLRFDPGCSPVLRAFGGCRIRPGEVREGSAPHYSSTGWDFVTVCREDAIGSRDSTTARFVTSEPRGREELIEFRVAVRHETDAGLLPDELVSEPPTDEAVQRWGSPVALGGATRTLAGPPRWRDQPESGLRRSGPRRIGCQSNATQPRTRCGSGLGGRRPETLSEARGAPSSVA